jgi:hypothetical protein
MNSMTTISEERKLIRSMLSRSTEFRRANFKEMWGVWLVNNPLESPKNWPKWKEIGELVSQNKLCFPCEEAIYQMYIKELFFWDIPTCNMYCPIYKKCHCNDTLSLYNQWATSSSKYEISVLAKEISECWE